VLRLSFPLAGKVSPEATDGSGEEVDEPDEKVLMLDFAG
jgi:hypothetical protein